MTGLTDAIVGEHGFERAAAWSAAGFALTLAAFRTAEALGSPAASWVAAGCTVIVALGTIGFTRFGGGVLPSALLAYGPLAAVLFETVGPDVSLEAGSGIRTGIEDGTGTAAMSVAEPFAVAVAAAVAVGGAGFVVGRALTALTEPDETNTGREADPERDAESDPRSDAT